MTEPAPYCARCRHRHAPALPCWRGQYARALTAQLLDHSNRCWIQGPGCKGVATTADHVIPRADWGTDDPENLRPACGPCNSARGRNPNPFKPDDEIRPEGIPLSPRWR